MSSRLCWAHWRWPPHCMSHGARAWLRLRIRLPPTVRCRHWLRWQWRIGYSRCVSRHWPALLRRRGFRRWRGSSGPRIFELPASSAWMPSLREPAGGPQRSSRPRRPRSAHSLEDRFGSQRSTWSWPRPGNQPSKRRPWLRASRFPLPFRSRRPARRPLIRRPQFRRSLATGGIHDRGGGRIARRSLRPSLPALAPIPVEAATTAPAHSPPAIAGKPAISLLPLGLVRRISSSPRGEARGFERQTADRSRSAETRSQSRCRGRAAPPDASLWRRRSARQQPAPAMPECQATSAGQSIRARQWACRASDPKWISRKLDVAMPRFGLRPVFERFEIVCRLGRKGAEEGPAFSTFPNTLNSASTGPLSSTPAKQSRRACWWALACGSARMRLTWAGGS